MVETRAAEQALTKIFLADLGLEILLGLVDFIVFIAINASCYVW
jgi:hypothetical protein